MNAAISIHSGILAAPLADLLIERLDVAFVSINPAIYSFERGRYFARRRSNFWPCISRSTLTVLARNGLGLETLGPENDRDLLLYGIEFTDLVKRATARAAHLDPWELRPESERCGFCASFARRARRVAM